MEEIKRGFVTIAIQVERVEDNEYFRLSQCYEI